MSVEEKLDIWKELREPFDKSGQTRPGFEDYLGRLDRVFGFRWSVKTRAEGSGIWCELKVWGEGESNQKSAIGSDFRDAFKVCCVLLGVGRPAEGD